MAKNIYTTALHFPDLDSVEDLLASYLTCLPVIKAGAPSLKKTTVTIIDHVVTRMMVMTLHQLVFNQEEEFFSEEEIISECERMEKLVQKR